MPAATMMGLRSDTTRNHDIARRYKNRECHRPSACVKVHKETEDDGSAAFLGNSVPTSLVRERLYTLSVLVTLAEKPKK